MISDEIDINDFYWGLKTKFSLEIGIVNSLSNEYSSIDNNLYPEIVWFQEGIFLVTSFNTSIGISNCTISLQGKDKMSLLNGDLGGQLFASIDFGQEEIKTAKMTQASVEINNSDVLMAEEYYVKPAAADSPEKISILDNTNYIFIADSSGLYYKKRNEYVKGIMKEITDANDNVIDVVYSIDEDTPYIGQRYTLFKKVMSPDELFEPVEYTTDNIPKNQYYFKKYEADEENHLYGYYVVNTTRQMKPQENYQLVTLYTLDYEYTIVKMPLEKIIRESVHAYAKEPYHNIIINDLDTYGLEQLTYRGDKPLYALRNLSTSHFTQMFMQGQNQSLDTIIQNNNFDFDPMVSETTRVIGTVIKLSNRDFTMVDQNNINTNDNTLYTVAKFEYGQDVGYRITDLTYTGDLVTGIGDTLVSMLDKIKAMLGDFEYFYDTTGHFIFQRKRTYVNTSWSLLTKTDDETFVNYVNSDHNKFSFNFEGNRLLTAVQHSPVLSNLRNDFTVWGKRKSVSGAEIPIHARYAIDKKPGFYHALDDKIYLTEEWLENNQNSALLEELDGQGQDYVPFEKAPVPECLWNDEYGNSDWWEVGNWGRWYELQVGAPPSGRMMSYQTGEEGFKGKITFPNGTILDCTNSWRGQLMIDLDASGNPYQNAMTPEEVREDGTIIHSRPYGSYRQHGWGGCGHTFLLVIKVNEANPGMKSYIYKPVLPDLQTQQQDIEQAGENPLTTNDLEGKRIHVVDWREIIYQMALDYFAGQGCSKQDPIYNIYNEIVMDDPDHLLPIIATNNPDYYPTGYTGYEQYYTDMQGFWRQLYNPDYRPKEIWKRGEYASIRNTDSEASSSIFFTRRKEWQQAEISDYEIEYYTSLSNPFVRTQYQELIARWTAEQDSVKKNEIYQQVVKYCKYCFQAGDENGSNQDLPFEIDKKKLYWNIDIFENPEKLNFWIEFLDSPTELAEFSIPVVGDRSKTINEDKASAIVFKEIPDLILLDRFKKDSNGNDTLELDLSKLRDEIQEESGYTFIYLPKGFSQFLTISYRSISVKNKIDELLYQFGYCIENISITALPIYHLQPNTRIYVQDKTTQINGEYIVNKITIPLTYNGTMSINANKAPERFY